MKTKAQRMLALIALICCESGFSQGTFYFVNYDLIHGLDAPVVDPSGNRLEGANYVAMLYAGATKDSLQAIAPASPFLTGGLAGYFLDRQNSVRAVPGVPGGLVAWVQVKVWDTRLGPTYEAVVALGLGGYGESNLFSKETGGILGGVPTPPEPLIGLQSFNLVPEPSAMVLLLLGLPLLLLRKRRCK